MDKTYFSSDEKYKLEIQGNLFLISKIDKYDLVGGVPARGGQWHRQPTLVKIYKPILLEPTAVVDHFASIYGISLQK